MSHCIENDDLCVTCGGSCCELFVVSIWADTGAAAAAQLRLQTDWTLLGPLTRNQHGVYRAPARCKHCDTGRCSIYETRPAACQRYPQLEAAVHAHDPDNCPIAALILDGFMQHHLRGLDAADYEPPKPKPTVIAKGTW